MVTSLDSSLDQLPDDSDTLKRMIIEIRSDYEIKLRELDEQYAQLKAQIRIMLQRHYGRSSEAAAGQGQLFNEAEATAVAEEPEGTVAATAATTPQQPPCQKGGRRPLPAHLPRLEVIHTLDESQRICPNDGSVLTQIGSEVSEQLEFIPATLRVIRHVRMKYACQECESTVVRAALPPSLLPKSQASPSLLAQIAISKYQDALPLYRQEAIFARHGIELSRTTLANWLIGVGDRLTPLLSIMQRDLLAAHVVHSDETTLQVLKESGRRADQRSYLWLNATATGPPIVLYHYAPSRSRAVVEDLLDGYRGTLVTDGYAAYDSVPARHAGCWAHARRKFNDALKAQTGARTGKAQVGFNFIQKLFVLERGWQDLDAAARHQQRHIDAAPLIAELKDWLDTSLVAVAPKTLTGKALGYLASQWPKLTVFLEDGEIPIHNNLAENKIRPFVIGRKNWLFCDTVAGAHTSAALYSLIETAKANDLEPMIYLHWLFATLPSVDPDDADAISALLPYCVDRDRIAADLAHEHAHTPAVR